LVPEPEEIKIKKILMMEFIRTAMVLKNYFFESITHVGYYIHKEQEREIDESLIDLLKIYSPHNFYSMPQNKTITTLRSEYENLEGQLIDSYKNLINVLDLGKKQELKSLHNYVTLSETIIQLANSSKLDSDLSHRATLEQYCAVQANLEKEAALNIQGYLSVNKIPMTKVIDQRDQMLHIKHKLTDHLFHFPKMLHANEILHIKNRLDSGYIWFVNLNDRLEVKGLESGLKRTTVMSSTYGKRKNDSSRYDADAKRSKLNQGDEVEETGLGAKLNCIMCFDTKPIHCKCNDE
jgi:hypothetical protein